MHRSRKAPPLFSPAPSTIAAAEANDSSSELRDAGAAATGPRRGARERKRSPPTGEVASPNASPDLARIVGNNLRRLRTKRGLSLERLARACGVSRAMLGQVELGQSTPTINILWKIARALGLPFSALMADAGDARPTVMRASTARSLTSHDGAFASRALFPLDQSREVEFYELRLAPVSVEKADPHPAGTKENLVVVEGALEMVVAGVSHQLAVGDAILFDADVPHEYWNHGKALLRMFLVMTYALRDAPLP